MGFTSHRASEVYRPEGDCPSEAELRKFLSDVSASESDLVAEHIAVCERCAGRANHLVDDALLSSYASSLRRTAFAGDGASERTTPQGEGRPQQPQGRVAQPLSDTAIPQQFGRYLLEQLLGRGGFGVVYLAQDSVLKRIVALKIATANSLFDTRIRARFLREAQIAARLHHPNIVPVFEAGEIDGQCFLAAEYIPGVTLANWIARQDRLQPRQAAEIMEPLARAVHHAHQMGVLHRDIKPGNVLLDDRDTAGMMEDAVDADDLPRFVPKLTDFGLARSIDDEHIAATTTGMAMGTPPYMAPEQARGLREELGAATDVYALGATLYELLVGKPPIVGRDNADTLRRVISEEPRAPRHFVPSIPRDLEAICLKCLEKRPLRRYMSAAQLADDLQSFLHGHTTLARPATAVETFCRWVIRHPQLAVGSLFATITLFVFFVVLGTLNLRLNDALTGAQRNERLAQEHLYASDIRLANAAWQAGDLRQFDELMRRHIPSRSELDARGLEWHYLWNRARVNQDLLATAEGPFYSVRFAPDGQQIAIAGADGEIRLYHGSSGREQFRLESGQGEVNGVAYSPDGQCLASAGDDGTVCVWCAEQPSEPFCSQFRIQAHSTLAYAVVYLDGGRMLASCGNEPTIRLWDARTGKSLGSLEGHIASVECLAASAEGRLLVSGDDSDVVAVWDLDRPQPVQWLRGHDAKVTCLAVSADGQWVVSGSQDRTVRYWNLVTGERRIVAEHNDAIQSLCLLPGERQVAVGDRSGLMRIHEIDANERATARSRHEIAPGWEALRGSTSKRWKFGDKDIRWCAVHQKSSEVFVATWDHVFLRNLQTGHVRELTPADPSILKNSIQLRDEQQKPPAVFDLSSSGNVFICVNEIYQEDLAAPAGWRAIGLLPEDDQRLRQVALSPDGKLVAYCCDDDRLMCWRVGDLQPPRELSLTQTHPVMHLEFSPDGALLAAAGQDSRIRLYDLVSGSLVRELVGHKGSVNQTAFVSPVQLVSCSDDQTLRKWDLETGRTIQEYRGHAGPIRTLALSPNRRWLMSVSSLPSHCRRLWDLESGQTVTATSTFPTPFDHVALEFKDVDRDSENLLVVRATRDVVDIHEMHRPDQAVTVPRLAIASHRGRLYGLDTAANRQIVTVGQDGLAVRINLVASNSRRVLSRSALDFATWKASRIVLASGERAVIEIDTADVEYSRRLSSPSIHWQYVGASLGGGWIAASSDTGLVTIWDQQGHRDASKTLPEHRDAVVASPTGRYVAMPSYDDEAVTLFDMSKASVSATLDREVGGDNLAFSPDERILFVDWQDNVNAWDPATGDKLFTLHGHTEGVHCMAASADGRWLATGGGDRTVVLWDLETRRPLRALTGHRDAVEAVCFSRDGRTLFSGDYSGCVKAWHIATGRELLQLDDTGSKVKKINVTEDGDYVVCLYGNCELVAYNVAATQESISDDQSGRASEIR